MHFSECKILINTLWNLTTLLESFYCCMTYFYLAGCLVHWKQFLVINLEAYILCGVYFIYAVEQFVMPHMNRWFALLGRHQDDVPLRYPIYICSPPRTTHTQIPKHETWCIQFYLSWWFFILQIWPHAPKTFCCKRWTASISIQCLSTSIIVRSPSFCEEKRIK